MPLWAALLLIFIAYCVGVWKAKLAIAKSLSKAVDDGQIEILNDDQMLAKVRMREVISSLL